MRTHTRLIRSVFRPGDEDAVTVLRLVGSANDLSMLFRLLELLREQKERNIYARTIAHGARRFILRMGHCISRTCSSWSTTQTFSARWTASPDESPKSPRQPRS